MNDIQSLFFINERLGWAIAYEVFPDPNSFLGTRILKTTDGGSNWINYMYPDTNKFMRSVYFLDSLTGFLAGAPNIIARTGNAGMTWETADTDTTLVFGLPVENIKFYNSQTGFACGGFRDIAGAMWTTTNGGFNWRGTVIAPEPFMDLYLFDQMNVIAVGGDFEFGASFVNSTNQGSTWHYDTLGTYGVATAVDFRTAAEGWITIGTAQKFLYTTDRAKTWNSLNTPDNLAVFDIQFTDSLHGWAVGYNGALLKYNPLISGISNVNNFIPAGISISQNYPNPFNPVTHIKYETGITGHISLKVFDVLGNEVITLVNGNQSPGKYSVSFDGSNLPSGVYFFRISTDGIFADGKSMLLLK